MEGWVMAHRYKGCFHKKGGLKIKRVGLNHTAHYDKPFKILY